MLNKELSDSDAANIFAIGVSYLLEPDEGIIVEFDGKLKVIVRNTDGLEIYINNINHVDLTDHVDNPKDIKAGMKIWMHDKELEN